jgi:glutaminyl-peptide cyclotransferase
VRRTGRGTSWAWWIVLAAGLAASGMSCEASPRFAVDGQRALRRVVFQVDAGPRLPGTPGHERVRAWLQSEIQRLGGRVETQRFTDQTFGRPEELSNVIGHWGPAGPGALVLCAHYDTRPACDEDPDPAHRGDPMPGANDAGSGVAVLLEVAELMSRRPPAVPVDLVFFDGEDQGRSEAPETYSRGARGYAARLPSPRPRAAFLFDMVGDKDLGIYSEAISVERAASLVDLVNDGARAMGAKSFHAEPRYHITDDHVPLLDANLPAVDIIDFDYPAWHTHRDLPDQVSAESLAEVSRVAAWIVYSSPLSRLR